MPKSNALAWQRWNTRLLASLAAAALALPALNFAIDPYDIFGSPFGTGPTSNQRVAHVRALAQNPGRYNVWLAGTSVMGINDPRVVDELLPGACAYNMSMFLGTSQDIVDMVSALARRSVTPQVLIVGIDPFLFLQQPKHPRIEFRMPPDVSGEPQVSWWSKALFAPSAMQLIGKTLDRIQERPSVLFDVDRGYYSLPSIEARLASDPEMLTQQSEFRAPDAIDLQSALDQAQFDRLADLKDLAARHGFQLVYAIQPASRTWLNAAGGDEAFRKFVERVRAHAGGQLVHHAEDLGKIADSPILWHDAKHYSKKAGTLVLSRLLQDPEVRGKFSWASAVAQ